MKYVLEFGCRRGAYTDNLIIPTKKLAVELASNLVRVFGGQPYGIDMPLGSSRFVWGSEKHFVALTTLDGVDRGPASAELWK